MCSPARENSNSGLRNSHWPAAILTPAMPLSVPALDVRRLMSRLVHRNFVVRRQTAVGGVVVSGSDPERPKAPPAYGCARPTPKYLSSRTRAVVTVESNRTSLKSAAWFVGSGLRCPNREATEIRHRPTRCPKPRLPSSSHSWTAPVTPKISRVCALRVLGSTNAQRMSRSCIVISGNATLEGERAHDRRWTISSCSSPARTACGTGNPNWWTRRADTTSWSASSACRRNLPRCRRQPTGRA